MNESNVVPIAATEEFPLCPLSDIIIIEQKREEMSKGGIALVGNAIKWPAGRVVAVGPGRVYDVYMDASGTHMAGKSVPCTVKVGDWVTWGKFTSGGEPFTLNGKRYVLAREGDIGCVSRSGNEVELRLDVPDA